MTPAAIPAFCTRRTLSLAFVGMLAVLTTCATGLEPPTLTATAPLPKVVPFVFGLGEMGCKMPFGKEQCAANAIFDPQEPTATVVLKPFAIDVHEVTNEQYRYCVAQEKCSLPAGDNGPSGVGDYFTNSKYDKFPVVMVRWTQAVEYCKFAGKRLPTEFEWEYVAGGPAQSVMEKRVFPWAPPGPLPPLDKCDKDANIARCNSGNQVSRAVMASADDFVDIGGIKVFDLVGNVAEFTASDFDDRVTCDAAQPNTCAACGTCLYQGKGVDCTSICTPCICGDNSTPSAKPNCYQPCQNPVCPRRLAGSTPLDGSYTGKNFQQKRMVRGGSYFNFSGAAASMDCDGRSDTRKQNISPTGDPQTHYGFRCAKDL